MSGSGVILNSKIPHAAEISLKNTPFGQKKNAPPVRCVMAGCLGSILGEGLGHSQLIGLLLFPDGLAEAGDLFGSQLACLQKPKLRRRRAKSRSGVR